MLWELLLLRDTVGLVAKEGLGHVPPCTATLGKVTPVLHSVSIDAHSPHNPAWGKATSWVGWENLCLKAEKKLRLREVM